MARATNPGAPQRVSAHVVPKAPSFSSEDEEEKTTIESGGWEEEASTTVEQGEVADRLRALALAAPPPARPNTAITATTGSGVSDEPTVDDQRASAALALLPPPSVARLLITQGNDTGRQLEVRPGKTYTVGRGVDNDLVLTDITASRKHFDLQHLNGSWILADRGSGNGTLVNSRIEDAPFLLASGDTIEVGNTAFRFEMVSPALGLPGLPREAPRVAREAPAGGSSSDGGAEPPTTVEDPSDSRELPTPAVHPPPVSRELITPAVLRDASAAARDGQDLRDGGDPGEIGIPHEIESFEGSVDDDLELSTVSGKPMQDAVARSRASASRPKTLPPPAPSSPMPRPRTQTGRPPMAFAATRSQQMAVTQPAPGTLPPAALAATMHAVPSLPQPATTLPLPQMASRPSLSPGLPGISGLPGMSGLPGLSDGPPTSSLPATLPGQGPPVSPNRSPRLPFAYPGASEMAPQRPSAMLRAQVNVTTGLPGRDATSTAQVHPIAYAGGQATPGLLSTERMAPLLSRRMRLALGLLGLAVVAAIATIAIIRSATGSSSTPARGSASVAPVGQPAPDPTPPATTRTPTVTPIQATPAASADRTGSAAAPASPPSGPQADNPGGESVAAAAAAAPAATAPAPTPAPQPPASAPTATSGAGSSAGTAAPAHAASTEPPAEPAHGTASDSDAPSTPVAANERVHSDTRTPRPVKHAEPKRPERKVEVAAAPPPPPPRPEKRHTGRSLQDVKSQANALYRSKNFSGAAAAINGALSGFGGDDARDLTGLAAVYSELGKTYAIGMAPGTKPVDAYAQLAIALERDRELGGESQKELRERRAAVAPRAATSFMAAHNFEQAFQAVHVAEELGSRSDDLKIVRQNLDDKARELMRAASAERTSDPAAAKKKARQVQGMVERQSSTWQAAAKLLNGQ